MRHERLAPFVWLAAVVVMTAASACDKGAALPGSPTAVATPAYSVTGSVRDGSASPAPTALAGARVEVIDGPFQGRSSVTDDLGVYRLFVLSGNLHLRVSKQGYETATLDVGPLARDTVVDAQLGRLAATLAGRVTESAPTEQVPIAGARVQILGRTTPDAAATTDSGGAFTLSGIASPVDIRVEADGYEPSIVRIDPSAGPLTRSIGLMPVAKSIDETVGSFGGPRRPPTSFYRDVHHAGTIVVSKMYFYYPFDPHPTGPDGNYTPFVRTVELWQGSTLVAAASVNEQQHFADVLSVNVPGGARYEIRLTGGEWSAVTIRSPN